MSKVDKTTSIDNKEKNWKGAVKFLKASIGATVLASVGNAYAFDPVDLEASVDKGNGTGDVKVEELYKVNNVLSESTFKDIAADYWALDSLKWAISKNIIKVGEDGLFKPNEKVTEAEFADMITNYYRLNSTELGKVSVVYNQNHWADRTYELLSSKGVPFLGYDSKFFRDRPVRKGVFAQAISYINGNGESLEDSVNHLFDLGFVIAKSKSYVDRYGLLSDFGVSDTVTREQAVLFLHRMYNKGLSDVKVTDVDGDVIDKEVIEDIKNKVDEDSLTEEEKKEKNKETNKEEGKEKVSDGSGSVVVDVGGSSGGTTSKGSGNSNASGDSNTANKSNKGTGDSGTKVKPKQQEKPKAQPKPKPKPKVTTETITKTESIAFKTVNKNDSSLEKGKTKVIQNGSNGTRTITYKVTYTNGKETGREQTGSKITKNPVDKIVAVGTKAPPKNDNGGGSSGSAADKVKSVYSNAGATVHAEGSNAYITTGSIKHAYSGRYLNITFNGGSMYTFDVATQAMRQLGHNVNVKDMVSKGPGTYGKYTIRDGGNSTITISW